ncbi:MAG: DJ-1/PfpI family protein [Clostridiales bacterium]|nr:DJ-1/PfpI family protein [Clostridiales bacterium]
MKKHSLVFLADGFEEVEAITVIDYLRRAGIDVKICSIQGREMVKGAHNISVKADCLIEDLTASQAYDAVILPGGLPGAYNLRDDGRVIELIQTQIENGRLVAAICAAPVILERAGLTKGRKGTSYPGFGGDLGFDEYSEAICVRDGNIITARGPATAVYFALEIIDYLLGAEAVAEIRDDILLDLVEEEACSN